MAKAAKSAKYFYISHKSLFTVANLRSVLPQTPTPDDNFHDELYCLYSEKASDAVIENIGDFIAKF